MKCQVKNRLGQPCKRNAVPGSEKCGPHSGLQDMRALGSAGGRHKKMNANLPRKTVVDFETFAWALEIALQVAQGKRSVSTALDSLRILCEPSNKIEGALSPRGSDEFDRLEQLLMEAMPMPASRW
jgi:hypothetical protein